jgi:hypothetical protein
MSIYLRKEFPRTHSARTHQAGPFTYPSDLKRAGMLIYAYFSITRPHCRIHFARTLYLPIQQSRAGILIYKAYSIYLW